MSVPSSAIISHGIYGAAAGGVLGYQLLRASVGADPFWLSAAAGAVIGGVAGAIYGALRAARAAEREKALQGVAQQRGQQFSADTDGVVSGEIGLTFSLRDAAITNVLRRDLQRARLFVGDLRIITERARTRNAGRTGAPRQRPTSGARCAFPSSPCGLKV